MTFLPPLDDIRRARAERKLRVFIEQAWPHVEPSVEFKGNWHLDAWCDLLEGVTAGHITKLLGNIPPGTMKSLATCVFWPAWEWLKGQKTDDSGQLVPGAVRRYLCGSFDDGLTIRDSGKTHDLVNTPWFQARWPHVQWKDGDNGKRKRVTTDGGWRIATSVGGKGTGEHPDIIIVDDPHNPKKAESDAERQAALDWFDKTLTTRGASRQAKFVIVMQRLHERDLSGHVLQRADAEQWVHFCVPMRYVPPAYVEVKRLNDAGVEETSKVLAIPGTSTPNKARRADIETDPRRVDGDLLWPSLFPEKVVKNLEAGLGSTGAAGQLQQQPTPDGGGLFKRADLSQFVDSVPTDIKRRARGWDKAGTDAAGDWTAGVRVSRSVDGSTFYVEHAVRDRLSSGKRNKLMLATAAMDGHRCRIRIEQEPGSGGKESAEISVREFAGYKINVAMSTENKVARARAFAIQVEAGNVRLVRGEWNASFIDELCLFPFGTYDDQVDAVANAFNELTLGYKGGASMAIEGWD